ITNIKDLPTKEDLKQQFLQRIKSDTRSKVLEKDLTNHLKEMYQLKINEKNISETAKIFQRQEMLNRPEVNSTPQTEIILATYSDKKITAKNILDHIYSYANQYTFLKTDEQVIQKAFNY